MILIDPERRHLASARLLPTTRPGILSALYPHLCEGRLPEGPDVFEITRFCLSREVSASERRIARNTLVTALASFALSEGIATYTGVAELGWLQQILAFGWDCRPLGLPQLEGNRPLGALAIEIDAQTLSKLAAAGIHGDRQPALAA